MIELSKGDFWYLATVYSMWPNGNLDEAYEFACRQTALLAEKGVPVFCPIAHTHGVGKLGGLPNTHEFWVWQVDQPFIDAAKGIIVVREGPWERSRGITYEITQFLKNNKPIIFMDRDKVPESLAA